MPENPYEKLGKFTSFITNDALSESNKIYNEIQLEKESALAQAEDDALNETFRYIKREISKIQTENGRMLSKKVMENKRTLNIRREEMKNELLKEVVQRIEKHVLSEEYFENLKASLLEVLETFNSETVVYLSQKDMPLVARLEKLPFKHNVIFKQGNFELGGLYASSPSKHLQIDLSFDSEMNEVQQHFYELFGLELAN